jgi:antitoxin ParD1/3/4
MADGASIPSGCVATNLWQVAADRLEPMAQNQNTSISHVEHFTDFIASSVRDGRYSSASDVVRAGLRLLEEHEGRVKAVRRAVDDSEKSGRPDEPFDFDAFLGRIKPAPQV